MGQKFIPNGDTDFVTMAEAFARNIASEPGRFAVSREDSEALCAVVATFRAAMTTARFGGERSPSATKAKEIARGEAEQHIRRIAHVVRATKSVDPVAKVMLNLRERSGKVQPLPCPQEPPRLRFVRALHEGSGATPMHELSFHSLDRKPKPPGAVRIELFVDLIPPDERIPTHPAANHASRPWYWRSYTRSPIVLAPPMARVPMRVVYWGRWADSTGNVGPFSATAAGWIEGGTHAFLPGGVMPKFGAFSAENAPAMMEDATAPGPAGRKTIYSVAVLEVLDQSFNPRMVEAYERRALEGSAKNETRQIEGPAEEAA